MHRMASMGPRLSRGKAEGVAKQRAVHTSFNGAAAGSRGKLHRSETVIERVGASMGPRLGAAERVPGARRRATGFNGAAAEPRKEVRRPLIQSLATALQWGRGWEPRKGDGRQVPAAASASMGPRLEPRKGQPGGSRDRTQRFNGAAAEPRKPCHDRHRQRSSWLQWGRGWEPRKPGLSDGRTAMPSFNGAAAEPRKGSTQRTPTVVAARLQWGRGWEPRKSDPHLQHTLASGFNGAAAAAAERTCHRSRRKTCFNGAAAGSRGKPNSPSSDFR